MKNRFAALRKSWPRSVSWKTGARPVLESIEGQGKLDEELRARLLACDTLTALEDLYLPYRPKRKTRAGEARRRGLEPLAACLLARCCPGTPWLQQLTDWGELENAPSSRTSG